MPHTRKQRGGVRSKTMRKSGIVPRFLKSIQTRLKPLNPKSKTKKLFGVSNENVKEKMALNANNLVEVMTSVNSKLKNLMTSYLNIEDEGSDLKTAISKVFATISEGLIKLHEDNKLKYLKGYSTLKKLGNPEEDAPERVEELTEYIDKVVIKKLLVPLGRLIFGILRDAFDEHKAELESATAAIERSASVNEEMNGNNARSSASNHRSRASSSEREEEELGDALGDLMEALKGAKI